MASSLVDKHITIPQHHGAHLKARHVRAKVIKHVNHWLHVKIEGRSAPVIVHRLQTSIN